MFIALVKDIEVLGDVQVVLVSATISPTLIRLLNKEWEMKDVCIIRGISLKSKILIYQIVKMFDLDPYKDVLLRLRVIRKSFKWENNFRMIVMCRSSHEIPKANYVLKTAGLRTFEYYASLPLERRDNTCLITVPSNLVGIDFKGCKLFVHFRLPVLIGEFYQDIGRLSRDNTRGLSLVYTTSEITRSQRRQSTILRQNVSNLCTPCSSIRSSHMPSSGGSIISSHADYVYDDNTQMLPYCSRNVAECMHGVYTTFYDGVNIDNCLFNCSSCMRRNIMLDMVEIKGKLEDLNRLPNIDGYISMSDVVENRRIMLELYSEWECNLSNTVVVRERKTNILNKRHIVLDEKDIKSKRLASQSMINIIAENKDEGNKEVLKHSALVAYLKMVSNEKNNMDLLAVVNSIKSGLTDTEYANNNFVRLKYSLTQESSRLLRGCFDKFKSLIGNENYSINSLVESFLTILCDIHNLQKSKFETYIFY
uniref:Helicase C-terminal domain-containing protein n=1 Tax=Strongyloides papillosus TaxID=174720 RepID=A0A0N5BLM4_STREA